MRVLRKKWGSLSNLALLLVISPSTQAQSFQNLVPNGSFETFTTCPDNSSQIYKAAPWTGPLLNSSDYNNACSTLMNVPHYGGIGSFYPYFLNAKDGVAYAGIFYYAADNFREYAQVELIDTLKYGICYYMEFYAANGQGPPYGANNVAAVLSATRYNTTVTTVNNGLINVTAHVTNYGNPILMDTVRWEKISGVYEALGMEKFLVIGNFSTTAQTDTVRIFRPAGFANCAYMFIDAVSIYSLNPSGTLPWSYRDTIINKGDSVFIGNKMGGLYFHPQWFTENVNYIKTNAGITVSPTVTTKYIVQYTLCGVQRSDTVKVTVLQPNDVALKKLKELDEKTAIFPNPANDILKIHCEGLADGVVFKVKIINSFGQAVQVNHIIFYKGLASINPSNLPQGLYSLQLICSYGLINKRITIAR